MILLWHVKRWKFILTFLGIFVSMWDPVLGSLRGAKNQDVDLKESAVYWGRQSYHTSDNKLNHVAKYSLEIQGSS